MSIDFKRIKTKGNMIEIEIKHFLEILIVDIFPTTICTPWSDYVMLNEAKFFCFFYTAGILSLSLFALCFRAT